MIEMKLINKSFGGIKALKDVDFYVEKGDIHALMGENGAGKSTLMKILTGHLHMDSGEIYLDGYPISIRSPKDAISHGIAMIHQELNIIPSMSVMENIWLNREDGRFGVINFNRMREKTKEILNMLQLDLDPDQTLENFSMAEKQMVEIAKAISYTPKLLIMDEPTSSLSAKEIDNLFFLIKKLSYLGTTVIYISHRMDEIQQICNKITVLRNGEFVGTRSSQNCTMAEIVRMMIGSDSPIIDNQEKLSAAGDPILSVENLSLDTKIDNVSFSLKRGEILGFAGLMGSGRSEIVECIYGIRHKTSGNIKINGQDVKISSPEQAQKYKIAMIPEDRKNIGLILDLSPCDNLVLPNLDQCSTHNIIDSRKETQALEKYKTLLNIKLNDSNEKVSDLSGGNQQKIVIAKNLFMDPDILIFDEPTRGVDIKSKTEICNLIIDLAKKGKAIIFISSELEEVIKICTRILVVRNGKICAEKNVEETSYSEILALSMTAGVAVGGE